jgi:hypothetical protein
MPRDRVEEYRRSFAGQWLNVIRGASPSLAAELERDDVLLDGELSINGREALSNGFANAQYR